MILLGTSFWKAFFDPANPLHANVKADLLVYDKEKILVDQYAFFKILVWLEEKGKKNHSKWFFDYVKNTQNVRLLYLGKGELGRITASNNATNILDGDQFEARIAEYLKNALNCDFA